MINYELVRSGRKTLAIEIKKDGRVIVRAPYILPKSKIDSFITQKQNWIEKHLEKKRTEQRRYKTVQ